MPADSNLLRQAVREGWGTIAAFDHYRRAISDVLPFETFSLALFSPGPDQPAWLDYAEGRKGAPTLTSPEIPQPAAALLAMLKRTGQPLAIDDLSAMKNPATLPLAAQGLRSLAVLPLMLGKDLRGGLLIGHARPSAFPRPSVMALLPWCDDLALALSQAELRAQVDEAQAELRRVSLRLLRAQEEQRAHLGRELHDEVGQALTALKLNLRSLVDVSGPPSGEAPPAPASDPAAVLADSLRLTSDLLEKVRSLSIDLHPPMLDDLGLAAALRWYARRAAERGSLELHLTIPEDAPRLPADTEIALFRIAQEAITNILRHAEAENIYLLLRYHPQVELHITDDGAGFAWPPASAGPEDIHGLRIMQERAALVGARLDIESAPGKGARIGVIFETP
jgi:signal transduction histidine kinase